MSTPRHALLLVVLLGGTAAAAPAVLAPPPEIAAGDAASFNVVADARDWYQRLKPGSERCFLVDHPDGAAEVDHLARRIDGLRDPAARAAYAAWLERDLRPAAVAAATGVAGQTWESLARRRDDSLAFLEREAPTGRVSTVAEATAFAARARAYRDRAHADHALVTRAMAETVCYSNAHTVDDPRFARFTWWREQTEPAKIDALVAQARDAALPPTPGFDAVRRFLAAPEPTDLYARGDLIRAGALAWKHSEAELPIAALVAPMADLFPADQQAALRDAPATFAALRDQVQARLLTLVDGVALPARASTAKLDGIVRPLVTRGRPVAWRVLAPSIEKRDYTDRETFERDGKTFVREWRVAVELIGVAWVSPRGDGNEVAIPGIPARELCWVWQGSAKRYSAGRGVPLRRWHLSEQLVAPIRCGAVK